jgi:hypothetical protein
MVIAMSILFGSNQRVFDKHFYQDSKLPGFKMHPFSLTEKEIEQVSGAASASTSRIATTLVVGEQGSGPVIEP